MVIQEEEILQLLQCVTAFWPPFLRHRWQSLCLALSELPWINLTIIGNLVTCIENNLIDLIFSERNSWKLCTCQSKRVMTFPSVNDLAEIVLEFSLFSQIVPLRVVFRIWKLIEQCYTIGTTKFVMRCIVLFAVAVSEWHPKYASSLRGYAVVELQRQNIFSPQFWDLFNMGCRQQHRSWFAISYSSTVSESRGP